MQFKCIICSKQYSSYKSLWNHKKVFHMDIHQQTSATSANISANISASTSEVDDKNLSITNDDRTRIITEPEQDISKPEINIVIESDGIISESRRHGDIVSNKTYFCRKCNRPYYHIQSRWRHEQTCKEEATPIENTKEEAPPTENANKEAIQKEIELKIAKENNIRLKEEAKILKLKLKLQQSNKIEKPTLKKLNDLLLKQQNRIKNSTVNSHNTTNVQNNIVNNHFQLIGFDKEHYLHEVLTPQEKRMIVNSKFCSLEKIIEIVHCGKYDQFKNVIITNMKDNYMYKYHDKKGIFVLSNKADVLRMLLEYRLGDLEIIYNELLENNKIDERTKSCIERFINQINFDTEKIKTDDGTTYENFRQFKINEIKVLLFNNTDKIMNDVSLLLSTEETQLENEIIV